MADTAPTLLERQQTVLSRFKDLFREPVSKSAPQPTSERRQTREEKLAEELGPWIAKAPAALWTELARLEADAHTASRENISDHAKVAYALGFSDAVARMKAQFKQWRGQSVKADPQGE